MTWNGIRKSNNEAGTASCPTKCSDALIRLRPFQYWCFQTPHGDGGLFVFCFFCATAPFRANWMGWLYSGACVCIWRGLFWVEVFSDYLSPYYTTTTTTPPGLSFILSAFKKVSPPVYPCHSRLSIRPRHTSSAPLGRSPISRRFFSAVSLFIFCSVNVWWCTSAGRTGIPLFLSPLRIFYLPSECI